jgi:hypothetical protein
MYPYLMGTFNFLAPISYINIIFSESSSSLRYVPFHTSHFDDPWTLPSLNRYYEGQSHIGRAMSLSTIEIAYMAIQEATTNPNLPSSWTEDMDPVLEPIWVVGSSSSHDFLDGTFPLDEAILDAMIGLIGLGRTFTIDLTFSHRLIGSSKMSSSPS